MTDTTKLQHTYERIAASESEVHWILGDQLVADVQAGYTLDELAALCEPIFQLGRTSIRNHHKVSTVFHDETLRARELSWSKHRLCATTARLGKEATYQRAYDWLNKAAEGKMTHNALGDAIAADKGVKETEEPVYLCKRVKVTIIEMNKWQEADHCEMVLIADDKTLIMSMPRGTEALLTMFIPAKVHTGEQLEATA